MTTPDISAIRARLLAATWQPIGDETPRNVQSSPGDNGRRPVLVTRWPITGAYKPVCVACLTVDGIWLGGRRRKLWFDPTHWMPLPEDPGEDAPADIAALLTAYAELAAEVERLRAVINTPEVDDWFAGVRIEAAHQVERWGSAHDAGKTAFDWFWLLGYLAQKAADAQVRGDAAKAKHHTISTAAALLNWHAALTGRSTAMRPGIDAAERGIE